MRERRLGLATGTPYPPHFELTLFCPVLPCFTGPELPLKPLLQPYLPAKLS